MQRVTFEDLERSEAPHTDIVSHCWPFLELKRPCKHDAELAKKKMHFLTHAQSSIRPSLKPSDNISNNSHLFILPAARQRVLPQVHLGAVLVVDLCVQVVHLAAAGRPDYLLLALTACAHFGLFSVSKARPGVSRGQFLSAALGANAALQRLAPPHGAHLVMLR